MSKFLRSTLLSLIAVALALVPALAQEEKTAEDVDKLPGVYEFEATDYGVVALTIAVTEDKKVTISAMGAVPSVMKHVEGNMWEIETSEWGLLSIGFVEEDDGSISALTLESYDFSFFAVKQKQ